MKRILLGLVLVGSLMAAEPADPVPGDERAAVVRALGKPRGRMMMGARETLIYDRGQIELATGRVTRVRLMTPEELAAKVTAEAEAAERAQQAYLARVAAGEQARADILDSADYRAASPAARIATWERFRKDHPDVPPPADYQEALAAQQEIDRREIAAREREQAKPVTPVVKRMGMGRYEAAPAAAP